MDAAVACLLHEPHCRCRVRPQRGLRPVVPVRLNSVAQLADLLSHDRHQFRKHGAKLVDTQVLDFADARAMDGAQQRAEEERQRGAIERGRSPDLLTHVREATSKRTEQGLTTLERCLGASHQEGRVRGPHLVWIGQDGAVEVVGAAVAGPALTLASFPGGPCAQLHQNPAGEAWPDIVPREDVPGDLIVVYAYDDDGAGPDG